jgi:predicted deacylase
MELDEYYSLLKKSCLKKGLSVKKIGDTGKNKAYPIFLVANDIHQNKKTICFCSGIHGDEIAPSLAILNFIKAFDFSRLKDINLIFIPIANPTGFEFKNRKNYQNIDINRHFSDKRLVGENKIIYVYLKRYKIYFFGALHEDLEEENFYMYCFEKKEEKIYREIVKLAKKYFSIKEGGVSVNNKDVEGHASKNGIISNITTNDGSIEYRLAHEGVLFSMCTETPGRKELAIRVRFNEEIIEKVIESAITRPSS